MEKLIPNTNGYKVTDDGRVFRADGNEVVYRKDSEGYLRVSFGKDGSRERVHRLVASAFVDNPDGKPMVDHIDGNKANNHASNLRWVTPRENTLAASEKGLLNGSSPSVPICIIDTSSHIAKLFDTQNAAARYIGCGSSEINKTLKGHRHTCHGYYVGYLEGEWNMS